MLAVLLPSKRVMTQRRVRLFASLSLGLLATAYRAWLTGLFWGHEEEDWANLGIIQLISQLPEAGLDLHDLIDLEHMPLYSWLSGIATIGLGDAERGGEFVAVAMGGISVALVTWMGMRWLAPITGIVAGLLLAFQPESALYAASPLRESTYCTLMLLGVLLAGERRMLLAGPVLSLSFLARFNAAFSLLPALALWVVRPPPSTAEASTDDPSLATSRRRKGLVAVAMLALTVLIWAAYYRSRSETGSWVFWGGVVERNSGTAVADLFPRERIEAIVRAVGGVFLWVLPRHIGWAVCALAALGMAALSRLNPADQHAARWLRLAGLSTLGLFAMTALVSAYPPSHNLYWKWLTPSVPYLTLFAAHAGVVLLSRLTAARGPVLAGLLASLLLVGTLWQYAEETRAQLALSEEYNGAQVRLAQWLEEAWPDGTNVLTARGEIADLYLSSRDNGPLVYDWLEHAPRDTPRLLGEWLVARHIGLVFWFDEEWTGASDVAGYLSQAETTRVGPATLFPIVRISRDDGMGFIAYQVEAQPAQGRPSQPPPADLARHGATTP